jgi:hypothetical protein
MDRPNTCSRRRICRRIWHAGLLRTVADAYGITTGLPLKGEHLTPATRFRQAVSRDFRRFEPKLERLRGGYESSHNAASPRAIVPVAAVLMLGLDGDASLLAGISSR